MTEDEKMDQEVARILRRAGQTPTLTKASGQVRGDGDLHTEYFMAENKYKTTEGFGISKRDWDKAKKQASKLLKTPVFFTKNMHGEILVTMSQESWTEWISLALAAHNAKNPR